MILNINDRKFTYFDSLNHEKEGYATMTLLSELFKDYVNSTQNREEDFASNLFKIKRNDNNKEKNEEEITNKLSTSFSSNLNNDLVFNTQSHVNININNINIQNVNLINKSESESESSSSELHMMASFWKYKIADVPKQKNGSDCGMFIIKYMDYITRDEKITFTQDDIPYFRILTGVELLKGEIFTYKK